MAVSKGADPNRFYQEGDVVDVLEDGVFPGSKVVSSPNFIIIDVPGKAEEVRAQLKRPHYDTREGKFDQTRAAFKVDPRGGFVSKDEGIRQFAGEAAVRTVR
jgi:hypothetical protein